MKKEKRYPSLLAATLSFWSGVASVLDIGSTFYTYNMSKTPEEADKKSLANDWLIVGDNISQAMNYYEQAQ